MSGASQDPSTGGQLSVAIGQGTGDPTQDLAGECGEEHAEVDSAVGVRGPPPDDIVVEVPVEPTAGPAECGVSHSEVGSKEDSAEGTRGPPPDDAVIEEDWRLPSLLTVGESSLDPGGSVLERECAKELHAGSVPVSEMRTTTSCPRFSPISNSSNDGMDDCEFDLIPSVLY